MSENGYEIYYILKYSFICSYLWMRRNSVDKIFIKRSVTVKTILTKKFKEETEEEFLREIALIDDQILQTESRIRQRQDTVLSNELSHKLEQLVFLKQELVDHHNNFDRLPLEEEVVTGMLDNYFELKIGDNLYDKVKDAEIVVRDGIIEKIKL